MTPIVNCGSNNGPLLLPKVNHFRLDQHKIITIQSNGSQSVGIWKFLGVIEISWKLSVQSAFEHQECQVARK